MNFTTLPNLIALAILVVVFWAISRKAVGEQVHLWLIGWALVLAHFAAQFTATASGLWGVVATSISLDSLILASVAFLISVSAIASNRQRKVYLAVAIAIPALAYTNGAILGNVHLSYYYVCAAIGLLAPLVLLWSYNQQGSLYAVGATVAAAAASGITVWGIARGMPELGITVILAALNFATAMLYWNHHKRVTAGVLTAVCGFVLWGAVFPAAVLLQVFASSVRVESEVWNIPKYLVAVGMILTLLEDQIERSTYLAYHDELTDLPNRRLLDDRLDQALAQASRTRSKVGVFVLDLDHFKEVNDTFGHRVGDFALREVVARLGSRIRASDTLARSGGDEFTIISQVENAEGARVLHSALESALSDPIVVEGRQVRTGLSIGLALYPDDGSGPDQLRAAADRAMYAAKRASRPAEAVGAVPQASC
ncbi:MAG: GGDEF domain-containing protein [Candidatus Korobacteraceae bacterium]|jgi:diguanylate cyclase (GGDEF)-like protein